MNPGESNIRTRRSQVWNLFYGTDEEREAAFHYINDVFLQKILKKIKWSLPPNTEVDEAISGLYMELYRKYRANFVEGNRIDLEQVGVEGRRYFRKFLIHEMTWFIGKMWRTYYKDNRNLSLNQPCGEDEKGFDLADRREQIEYDLNEVSDDIRCCRDILDEIYGYISKGEKKLKAFDLYYGFQGEKLNYEQIAERLDISLVSAGNYIKEVFHWFSWLYMLRERIGVRYSKIIYNQVLKNFQESLSNREWLALRNWLHEGKIQDEFSHVKKLFRDRIEEEVAFVNPELSSSEIQEEKALIMEMLGA